MLKMKFKNNFADTLITIGIMDTIHVNDSNSLALFKISFTELSWASIIART